ncbi:hypothetical protein PF003_g5130 [Phytophthora fragariae]|nr:hypothetical protein PF003_g5130 [Phytophthora fragariae]
MCLPAGLGLQSQHDVYELVACAHVRQLLVVYLLHLGAAAHEQELRRAAILETIADLVEIKTATKLVNTCRAAMVLISKFPLGVGTD